MTTLEHKKRVFGLQNDVGEVIAFMRRTIMPEHQTTVARLVLEAMIRETVERSRKQAAGTEER